MAGGDEEHAPMRTYTAHTTVKGRHEDVFVTLIDPDSIRRWSPVDFEVEHLDGDRLEAGGRARVIGRLAGLRVGFDVDVIELLSGGALQAALGRIAREAEDAELALAA